MLSVFLLQLAGGSMLAIGLGRIDDMAWRYLRLMGFVSFAALALVALLFVVQSGVQLLHHLRDVSLLLISLVLTIAWLVANAIQAPQARPTQRVLAFLAGLVAVLQCSGLVCAALNSELIAQSALRLDVAAFVTILLGSLLIGSVTASMLLGHRYLTDTGMTIAPLRRIVRLVLIVITLRTMWAAVFLEFAFHWGNFERGDLTWTVLLLSLRGMVGLLGTAVFAYMIWDCVRRRSTQSATGILYLTMVFVFIGELTAQYLLRWKGLAV